MGTQTSRRQWLARNEVDRSLQQTPTPRAQCQGLRRLTTSSIDHVLNQRRNDILAVAVVAELIGSEGLIKAISMKSFISTLITCAVMLLATNPVFSQGSSFETRPTDENSGYSFTVPTGFKAQKSDEGFALVNTAQTILIVVKSHDFQTMKEFDAQSNLERDGLTQVGKVQDVGNKGKHFRVSKQTPQGLGIVDTFVMFSTFGGGTLVVAISETANHEEGFQAGLRVAESVAFTKRQTSSAETQWQTVLRGKHLLYLYTANGFSERRDIYLCPSGEFYFHSDTLSNSSTGSGVLASNSDGRWKNFSARCSDTDPSI